MKERDYSTFWITRRGAGTSTDEMIQSEWDALVTNMKTANGVKIVEGLRVWTNDLERGVVTLERLDFEWHHGEKRWVPWFDVVTDDSGRKVMQSDDRVATRFQGEAA